MEPEWFANADYDTERRESQRLGLGGQAWGVAAAYEIDHDVILPVGDERLYFPMGRPRLPFELAKISGGNEGAAVAFARKWGLLGHWALVDSKDRVGGDPLEFVLGHAYVIRNVLTLIDGLRRGDPDSVSWAIGETFPEEPISRRNPNSRYPAWRWLLGARPIVTLMIDDGATEEDLALRAIANTLSGNLKGIHPAVVTQVPAEGTSRQSPISRLRRTFRWRALVEVAYWHLWNLIERGRPLAICQECGGFFERTDARQQFCPPPEDEVQEARTGLRSRSQSKCGLRHRMRKLRRGESRPGRSPGSRE